MMNEIAWHRIKYCTQRAPFFPVHTELLEGMVRSQSELKQIMNKILENQEDPKENDISMKSVNESLKIAKLFPMKDLESLKNINSKLDDDKFSDDVVCSTLP